VQAANNAARELAAQRYAQHADYAKVNPSRADHGAGKLTSEVPSTRPTVADVALTILARKKLAQ
jgi:hypothetical protein